METITKFNGNIYADEDSFENKIAEVLGDITVVNYLLKRENWSDLLGIIPPTNYGLKRKRVTKFDKQDTYLNYLQKLAKFTKQMQPPIDCYSAKNLRNLSKASINNKSNNTNAKKSCNNTRPDNVSQNAGSTKMECSDDSDANSSDSSSDGSDVSSESNSSRESYFNSVESRNSLTISAISQKTVMTKVLSNSTKNCILTGIKVHSLSDSSSDDEDPKDTSDRNLTKRTMSLGNRQYIMELKEINLSESSSSDIEDEKEQKEQNKNNVLNEETIPDKNEHKSDEYDRKNSTEMKQLALPSSSCNSPSSDDDSDIHKNKDGIIKDFSKSSDDMKKSERNESGLNRQNVQETSISGLSSLESFSEQTDETGKEIACCKASFNSKGFSNTSSPVHKSTTEKQHQAQDRKNSIGSPAKNRTVTRKNVRSLQSKIKCREFLEDSMESSDDEPTSSIQKKITQPPRKKRKLSCLVKTSISPSQLQQISSIRRRVHEPHLSNSDCDNNDSDDDDKLKMSENKQKILRKLVANCQSKTRKGTVKGSIITRKLPEKNFNGVSQSEIEITNLTNNIPPVKRRQLLCFKNEEKGSGKTNFNTKQIVNSYDKHFIKNDCNENFISGKEKKYFLHCNRRLEIINHKTEVGHTGIKSEEPCKHFELTKKRITKKNICLRGMIKSIKEQ